MQKTPSKGIEWERGGTGHMINKQEVQPRIASHGEISNRHEGDGD